MKSGLFYVGRAFLFEERRRGTMASDHNQEQSNLLEAEISLTMGSLTSQTSSFAEQAEVLIASFDDMAEGTGAIDIVGRKLQAIVQKIRSISNNINDIESTTDFSEAVLLAQRWSLFSKNLQIRSDLCWSNSLQSLSKH